jgi:serine/threonine protein kinase
MAESSRRLLPWNLRHLFSRAILYELLSGRRAFRKDTPGDTLAAIIRDEPPELTATGRDVSPALDHIVRHCLEKDPDRGGPPDRERTRVQWNFKGRSGTLRDACGRDMVLGSLCGLVSSDDPARFSVQVTRACDRLFSIRFP